MNPPPVRGRGADRLENQTGHSFSLSSAGPATMKPDPSTTRSRKELTIRKKVAFSLVVTAALGLLLYIGFLGFRTIRLYRFIKDSQRGWHGRTLAADPVLGYAPIPGATGVALVPMGPGLPVRFDDHGFRVPFEEPKAAAEGSPSVLTLGCSYTYGDLCLAEEAYPHILSRLTGCRSLNAGMTSYGLAQMLILARRLIPQYRPNYVVVQYSPWLVQRAQNFYAHGMNFVTTPVPFFSESSDRELRVNPPIFRSKAAEIAVNEYRSRPAGIGDYCRFLAQIGAPLLLYDDFQMTIHRLKRLTGFTPAPAADDQKIIDTVYKEIANICQSYNSRMIILVLGSNTNSIDHAGLDRIPGARIVDAHAALLKALPERTPEGFRKMYGHWRGNPPVFVDDHPNPTAHRIIAQELAKSIDKQLVKN
jgi:hypothetical protein